MRDFEPERWQSGRMYLTRNQAMWQRIRGFESHPLRQCCSKDAPFGAFFISTRIPIRGGIADYTLIGNSVDACPFV